MRTNDLSPDDVDGLERLLINDLAIQPPDRTLELLQHFIRDLGLDDLADAIRARLTLSTEPNK